MKTGIKTLFEALILDDQNFIKDGHENIRDYYNDELFNNPDSIKWYLSDIEIKIFETGSSSDRQKLFEEVQAMLSEYDISIYDYLEE